MTMRQKNYVILLILSLILGIAFSALTSKAPFDGLFISASLGRGFALFILSVPWMKFKSSRAGFIALTVVLVLMLIGEMSEAP